MGGVRLYNSKAGMQAGRLELRVYWYFCHSCLIQAPQQPCEAETTGDRDAVPISDGGVRPPGEEVLPSRDK